MRRAWPAAAPRRTASWDGEMAPARRARSRLSRFCRGPEMQRALVGGAMMGPHALSSQVPASRPPEPQVEDEAWKGLARGTPVRMGRRHRPQTLRRLSVLPQARWVPRPLQVWLVSMTT